MDSDSWIEGRLAKQYDSNEAFEEAVFTEGALDPGEKRLCAIVAANIARDRETLRENIEKAKEEGLDEDAIAGALSAAWMTSGSTQIYWAEDVFEETIEHAWYKRRLKEASRAYGEFHDAVMEDGPLPEVLMEVLSTVVASMERCEHCTESHIKQALDRGATKDQIAEALAVAWYVGGASQVHWLGDRFDDLLG
jgi:AhpD family alkylhydroperoxidase